MMKAKRLFLVFLAISIVILTACSQSKPDQVDQSKNTIAPPLEGVSKEFEEEGNTISPPDLTTEEGIRQYLVGEWTCKIDYMSNILVTMNVSQDLDVQLSFYDTFTDENKGEYKGKISLDRLYARSDEGPDLMTFNLDDDYYSKADFFFLHRTIYDGKRVMSLFFTGDGKSVFDILLGYDDEDYDYIIDEVMLEKISGEVSQGEPRKNESFYAVFWGHQDLFESIWLDRVYWTPPVDEEYVTDYPRPMTLYERDRNESIVYNVAPEKDFEILGDNMFKGTVYYVETDENGNMIELIDAAYKDYLEEGGDDYIDEALYDYVDPEIKDLIYHIIMTDIFEIQEYLDDGMNILFTGESIIIDDEECYFVFLGTGQEESFVREIHYAVNPYTEQVYRYDTINDIWETVGVA